MALLNSFDLALVFACFEGLSLVRPGLSARQCDCDLGEPTFVEVDPRGHERESLLFDLRAELSYFPPVQQEFAAPKRLVTFRVSMAIGCDVTPDKPNLVVVDSGVRLVQRGGSIAETLDFRAEQAHAALDFLDELKAVPGLAVLANGAFVGGCFGHN